MKIGVIGLVVAIAAYVTLIVLYATTGMGPPHPVANGQPASDGTTVTLDVQGVQAYNGVLVANVTVSPGPALVDPETYNLKDDFSVAVTSAVTPTKRTWPKGTVPGSFPVSLGMTGDVSDWPFDGYRSGPVTVVVFRGAAQVPERMSVTFVDRLPGWKVDIPGAGRGDQPAPYRVEVQRSPTTAAFALVLVGLLVSIAGIALFVAVQTARDRRKFQPPMATWFAAMLFAVIPLRNALPDSPPFGAWIDVIVVLWVIVALVIAMIIYVSCWWRHLAPEVDEPTKVEEPTDADEPPEPVGSRSSS